MFGQYLNRSCGSVLLCLCKIKSSFASCHPPRQCLKWLLLVYGHILPIWPQSWRQFCYCPSSRDKPQNVSDSQSASVLSWIEDREGPSLTGPLQWTSLKRYTFFKFSVTTMIYAFTLPFYHNYTRLSANSNLQHIVRGKTGI